MVRVGLLGRSGAGVCPNLLQRGSGPGSAARRSAEYQRFSSGVPARSGPLQQIWTNSAAAGPGRIAAGQAATAAGALIGRADPWERPPAAFPRGPPGGPRDFGTDRVRRGGAAAPRPPAPSRYGDSRAGAPLSTAIVTRGHRRGGKRWLARNFRVRGRPCAPGEWRHCATSGWEGRGIGGERYAPATFLRLRTARHRSVRVRGGAFSGGQAGRAGAGGRGRRWSSLLVWCSFGQVVMAGRAGRQIGRAHV